MSTIQGNPLGYQPRAHICAGSHVYSQQWDLTDIRALRLPAPKKEERRPLTEPPSCGMLSQQPQDLGLPSTVMAGLYHVIEARRALGSLKPPQGGSSPTEPPSAFVPSHSLHVSRSHRVSGLFPASSVWGCPVAELSTSLLPDQKCHGSACHSK